MVLEIFRSQASIVMRKTEKGDNSVYFENFTKANQIIYTLDTIRDLNLNLNSLLVKRQIDNPSPGAVTGGN